MVFIGQTSKESKLIPCWNIMFRSKKENYEIFISLDVAYKDREDEIIQSGIGQFEQVFGIVQFPIG